MTKDLLNVVNETSDRSTRVDSKNISRDRYVDRDHSETKVKFSFPLNHYIIKITEIKVFLLSYFLNGLCIYTCLSKAKGYLVFFRDR